jgi:hypothetical protein
MYPLSAYTIRMSADMEYSSVQKLKKLAIDNGLEKYWDEKKTERDDDYISYFSVPGKVGPEKSHIHISILNHKPEQRNKHIHIRISNLGTGFGSITKAKIDELGEIFHQEILKLAIDKERVEFTRRLPWCYKEGAIRK